MFRITNTKSQQTELATKIETTPRGLRGWVDTLNGGIWQVIPPLDSGWSNDLQAKAGPMELEVLGLHTDNWKNTLSVIFETTGWDVKVHRTGVSATKTQLSVRVDNTARSRVGISACQASADRLLTMSGVDYGYPWDMQVVMGLDPGCESFFALAPVVRGVLARLCK